ncbi:MAG: phosphoribosylglycinamide formyltransferase [Verrucomicrobiota bacterium]
MSKLKLGILGSGKGSNFVAIQEAILRGELDAEVKIVISDHETAGILDRARKYRLKAVGLPPSKFKTKLEPEIEVELVRLLKTHDVNWVILAGYMRVVKAPLLEAYPNRILNIHPSLLPAFKGLEAWAQAFNAGVKETGCTVHYVNAGVDEGEVLGQIRVPVEIGDTPQTLHERIQKAEHLLFPQILQKISTTTEN